MKPRDTGIARLDLRLVPAALTSWAATAAGILWQTGGSVLVVILSIAATAAVGRWGSGRREAGPNVGALLSGVVAVAVVGTAFAVAVGLRVGELRHHPIVERYGTVATVVVTPSETPRSLGGGRMMFRGSLQRIDASETSGRVVVFTRAVEFGELTAGRPASFRARIGRPSRRDLTVAVLSATDQPRLGEAATIDRVAHGIRTGFADAARTALPVDQAAMLPALVLGDTSTLNAQTVEEFRTSGLTHLTAVSGANVTVVCGAVLMSASLFGPRLAVALAAVALVAFVIVVQPSASVLRAALMGAAPDLSVDVGFALSVAATAALVVIAPVWSRRLVERGWPKPLADAVSVAVAAQLVTAPLVAGISGAFSVLAVIANLAVAAVIPPITVVGTAAAALNPLWPSGAQLLIRFTGPELWWLLRVARWAAGVPGASIRVPSGLLGVGCVAVASVAAVVAWRWRAVRIGAGLAAMCLLAWTLSGLSGGHDTIVG